MVVEIISVGTELLMGNTVNTNANYLAKKCVELGLINYHQVTVGDNEDRLENVIKTALSRSDIIILSGGLGPTSDDITKEITAKALGRELVKDLGVKEAIQSYFTRSRRLDIPHNNWKQSYIIEGSTVVENHNGTAPGLIVDSYEDYNQEDNINIDKTIDDNEQIGKTQSKEEQANKIVILLPGPPRELIPMFEDSIMPYLRSYLSGTFYSETIKIIGYGESEAVLIVSDLIDNQANPTIAPYAKLGEVHFRITASANDEEEGKILVSPIVEEFKNRFGNSIFTSKEEEELEEVVVDLLLANSIKLTTAESCTGGLLSGKIVNVSGASSIFNEGFITYSNEAKEKHLGVKRETLERFGAVSRETAIEMAVGVAKNTGSDTSLAITGIAGPEGGTEEKPVGLVYIACFLDNNIRVKEYHINGNRQAVRERAVIYALDMLRKQMIDQYGL